MPMKLIDRVLLFHRMNLSVAAFPDHGPSLPVWRLLGAALRMHLKSP